MAREYTVLNSETGREITFDWDDENDPTDADLEEIFSAADQFEPEEPPQSGLGQPLPITVSRPANVAEPSTTQTSTTFEEPFEPTSVTPAGFTPKTVGKAFAKDVRRAGAGVMSGIGYEFQGEGKKALTYEELDENQRTMYDMGKSIVESGEKPVDATERGYVQYYKNLAVTKPQAEKIAGGIREKVLKPVGEKMIGAAEKIKGPTTPETQQTEQELQDAHEWLKHKDALNPKNIGRTVTAAATVAAESGATNLLSAVPVAGVAVPGLVEKTGWIDEAKASGLDDPDLLNKYGDVYGLLSGGVERMGGEILFAPVKGVMKGKVATKAFEKVVSDKAKGLIFKKVLKGIAGELGDVGIGALAEGGEEFTQAMLSDAMKYAAFVQAEKKHPGKAEFYRKQRDAIDLDKSVKSALEQAYFGAIGGGAIRGVTGAAAKGIGAIQGKQIEQPAAPASSQKPISEVEKDFSAMQYPKGGPNAEEGRTEIGATGGQAGLGGEQAKGVHLRDDAGAGAPEAPAEANVEVIEPLDENRIVGMVERLKAAGTAQEKQAIVEGITGEEAKEVLRRAQGIPKADVSKLSKEEVGEVSAYGKEGRSIGGRQYEGGALPEVERKQRGIILNKNEEFDKLGPELEKQIDGIKYGGAQEGIARPGKAVQPTMTFRDEFTGSNVNITREGGLEELKKKIADVRQADPEAVAKSIAGQVGGLEYVGSKPIIGQPKQGGAYTTENTYQFKTEDGIPVTINPGDTVERIKSYLKSKKGGANAERTTAERPEGQAEALLKGETLEPPTVTAPTQKEPIIKGPEDLKKLEVEFPKTKPFSKLHTRVTDVILNRYIKKGLVEGKTATKLHNNVVQLIDRAASVDLAEASGITEDEAKTAVADIKAGKRTEVSQKVLTAIAPRLLYNQTVDDVYNEITMARDTSGKVMFSKKEPMQQNVFGGEKSLSEIESEEKKRIERAEVKGRIQRRRGGEADMSGLPMFENQNIEGSQQTLFLKRYENPDQIDLFAQETPSKSSKKQEVIVDDLIAAKDLEPVLTRLFGGITEDRFDALDDGESFKNSKEEVYYYLADRYKADLETAIKEGDHEETRRLYDNFKREFNDEISYQRGKSIRTKAGNFSSVSAADERKLKGVKQIEFYRYAAGERFTYSIKTGTGYTEKNGEAEWNQETLSKLFGKEIARRMMRDEFSSGPRGKGIIPEGYIKAYLSGEDVRFSKKRKPSERQTKESTAPTRDEEQVARAVYASEGKKPAPGAIRIVEGTAEQKELSEVIKKVTGKEVVWLDVDDRQLQRDLGYAFDGFMIKGAKVPEVANRIFISTTAEKPIQFVAYHEFAHFIQQNPDYTAAFWDAVKLTPKGAELVARKGRDETMADIAGEMMAEPNFWKSIAEDKTILQAFINKLIEILDRLAKAFTGRKDTKRYAQYVEDVEGLRDTLKGILREYGGEQATGEQRMAASRRFKWGPETEKEIDVLEKRMYDIQQGVFKRMNVMYNEDWMDNLTSEESDEWRELSYKIKKLQGMPTSYILKNEAQQIMEAGQRRLGGDDFLTSWRTKLSQKEKDRLDEIQLELSATTVDYDDPEVPDQLKQRFQEDLFKSIQKQPGFKKWVEIPKHLKAGMDAITRTIQDLYDENEIENITSGEKRIESNEIEELNTPKTALVYSPEFADEILPMKYRFGIGSWFVVGKKVGSKDTPYVVKYKNPLDLSYKMSINVVEKLVDDLPNGSDWAKFKGKRDRLEGVFNAYYDALVNPKQPNELEIEARSSSTEETEAMMSRESQIRQQAYNPNIMFLASIGEEIGDGNVVESLKEMGIDSILMKGKNNDYIMPIEDIFGNYNVANLYGDWKKEAPIVKERDVLHGDTRKKVTIKGEPDWNNIKTKIQYDEPVQKEKIYLYGDKFTVENPKDTGGWKYSYNVDNAVEAASWAEKNKNNSYWRNFLDTKKSRNLFDSYNGEIDKKVLDELAIIKEKEAIPKTVIEFYYDGHYHKTTVPGKVDDADAKEAAKKEWIDRHGNKDREEYQYQKRRDKYEGKESAREVDKKIIDAVGGYPDIRYSKKSGEGQPMFSKKVTEADLPELYEEAKGFNKKKSAKEIRKIYANKRNAGETARWLLRTTTGRLMDISPVIRDQVQKHVSGITLDTAKATRKILPLLNALKKMPNADYRVFDLAAKQADTEKINELAKQYGFEEALKSYRDTFNGLIKRLMAAGYETGYLKDYFPRMSKDRDAYRNFIRGVPEWGSIDEAIREKEKKIGRTMTDEEQEEFLDLYIRGYSDRMNAAKPGNLKERKVKLISNEMNSLLEDTMVAIPLYVERMIKKAARKEFFDPQQKDTELEINNIDDSIGEYVSQLIKDKKLDPRKQDELIGILKSFFNYKPTNKSFAAIKNLGYMTTMGSGFSSMFSQMADAAFGFYTTGVGEIPAVVKALFGKTGLTVKDLGVDNVAGEFRDPGKIADAVDKLFKAVGIKWGDSIFKNAFLEANLRKYQRMAKSGKLSKDLKNDLKNIFGDQTDSVINDLSNGVDSDNVKLLMLNQMSKFQPVTLLQVPQAYLDMPRGRIAYALKTYQINQLNAIIDEAKRGMATATTQKDFKEAALRVATLMAFLVACGIGTDAFKDYLFRRKANFGEYLTDNMLKLALISRYTTWKFRTDGIKNTVLNLIAPQISWVDYIGKDVTKIQKAATTPGPNDFAWKDLQSIRVLPVIGQELYWWYGGGHESVLKREKRNAPPAEFKRDIIRQKKIIRNYTQAGDTKNADKQKEVLKKMIADGVPEVKEYYEKELKKDYPGSFETIKKLQDSEKQIDRARAKMRINKLTAGQQRLYGKYVKELQSANE